MNSIIYQGISKKAMNVQALIAFFIVQKMIKHIFITDGSDFMGSSLYATGLKQGRMPHIVE
jgi:hypothetical protein